MPGKKYDAMPQNGACSRESNVRTLVFKNKLHSTTKMSTCFHDGLFFDREYGSEIFLQNVR
jgi:hypothetical protein